MNRKHISGTGRFTDDWNLPNQAYGVFCRSPIAHGVIRAIDLDVAKRAPGVLAAVDGRDLEAAGIGPLPFGLPLKSRDGAPLIAPKRFALPTERVRHVGEPLCLIVAESRNAALDAAELVELDIETLPSVADAELAMREDAPSIWSEAPNNTCLDWQGGDAGETDAAFAKAAHVTRLRVVNNRVVGAPMEPKAALASYDSTADRLTLVTGSQGVFAMRRALAQGVFKIPEDKLTVRSYDVGGSFGIRAMPYPEHVALLFASRLLNRPVKWREDRTEGFLSDHHGRDMIADAELALDADGRFLGVRIHVIANMGAHLGSVGPLMCSVNILKNASSLYRTGAMAVYSKAVFTNTTYVGAYRGAGRPDGNLIMERLVDEAARQTGRDPIELRRLNLIRPEDLPYRAPSGMTYDSGDFERVLDACVKEADWKGFSARQAASKAEGKLRGRGVGLYLEVTAPPNKEMGGIRFDADGGVSVISGTQEYGQGLAPGLIKIVSDQLGLSTDRLRLVQGDSDVLVMGGGSGGSRSTMAGGSALYAAAKEVIERGKSAAAHVLEAAAEDIVFDAGAFKIAGTDRGIAVLDLAARLKSATDLPEGVPKSLDVALVHADPPSAFPNGCHIAEVEIDPETGAIRVDRYTAVNDVGAILNPPLVEAQIQGGVAQGIGQALLERVVYDEDGQLLSGSFMDYALPRAADVPGVAFSAIEIPAKTNPLGVKGCGEAGVTGALPTIVNAVHDALAPTGVRALGMPATPEAVWVAIEAARRAL